MAAFAQATPTPAAVSTRTRAPSHTKLLHDGPCNYVNADLGLNAPRCGCQRFWSNDNLSVESPYCVCGHHTVFHSLSNPPLAASTSIHLENSAPPQTTTGTSFSGRLVKADSGAHEGRFVPVDGLQPDPSWNLSKAGWQNAATPTRRTPGCDPVKNAPQPPVFATGRQLGSFGGNHNLSPLPSIPSMCRLDSSDLRPLNNQTDSMATEIIPSPVYRNLAMSMHSTTEELNRVLTTPTHAGFGFHKTLEPHRWREVSLDPTVQDSTDGESTRPRNSPSRTFMTQILARRTAQNNEAPRPVPQTANQTAENATEIATGPENTPDFGAFDQNIQETRGLIDNLCEDLADIEKRTDIADVKDEDGQNLEKEGAHASQDGRDSRTVSLLRRLAPNLNVLHKHLTAYPNVSTEISDFKNRLIALENASFQHIPPEEIMDKFEHFEGRLLELEQRAKDYMADYEIDSSNQDTLVASDASGNEHDDAIRRLEALEYRLENLEATLPSASNPWEIEVVLLPWGRDLKGIWFPALEGEGGSAGSQSSEDRTQSISSLSSVKAQPLLMSVEQTAWSKEAINHWANDSQESAAQGFLAPRACGRNGIPYKRLKSRGFVRRVLIKEPGAEHIHTSICAEFDELIDLINSSCRPLEDEDSQMSDDEQIGTTLLHGMRASILPLKKKRKDAQLMFLGPSELVTPTLWNAHFLASGVMMRARGGVKRLYMTHGAAYQQSQVDDADGWTWESIRRLPRFNPSSNGHHVRVGEADAREACWEFHPNFDRPFSTPTSFTSNLSLRTGRNPSQESSSSLGFDSQGNESSGSQATTTTKNKAPVTPQSELLPYAQPLRPARRLERTASAPMPQLERQHSHSSSKRRMNLSFEDDAYYDENDFTRRASADVYTSRKRRRFRRSRSPTADAPPSSIVSAGGALNVSTAMVGFGSGAATRDAFGFTPRRSREPSSPARSQLCAYRGASVASGGGYGRAGSVAAGVGTCKGSSATPGANNAYMTPHSGMAEGGTYVDGLFEGGDTEADSSGDDAEDDEMADVGMVDEVKAAAAEGSQEGGDFGGWSGLENDDDDDDDDDDDASDDDDDVVDVSDLDHAGQGDLDMELEYDKDNDEKRETRGRRRKRRDDQRHRPSPQHSTTASTHVVDDTDVSVEIDDPSDNAEERTASSEHDHDLDDGFSSPSSGDEDEDEDVDVVGSSSICGPDGDDNGEGGKEEAGQGEGESEDDGL
ncbi:hypothetical protein IWZ00DRAFT_381230 [Phyllosticta capitalensis]